MNLNTYLIGCLDFLAITAIIFCILIAPSELTLVIAALAIWGVLARWGL